mgnify:CR=1 FL=1
MEKQGVMALSYNNLWHLLIDRKMTKTQLRLATGISSVTLAKLSKNEPVNAATLEKICSVLKCHIGDVVDFVPDPLEDETRQ